MIYGEGNTVPVPSLDLLTFLFSKPLIYYLYTLCNFITRVSN